jgi:hypothetical protein
LSARGYRKQNNAYLYRRAGRGFGHVVKLQAPSKVPSLIQDGAAWRCTGDTCAAPQVKSLPIGRACRKVAAELGAVSAFNYRGVDLDAAGLADCNTAAKS